MRKIIVSEFISVDGVIEAPETWHFPFVNEEVQTAINAGVFGSDAYLYGRVTYEAFASFWPTADAPEVKEMADYFNKAPKYVVSNTLRTADWSPTTIFSGDVMSQIAQLKETQGGNIGLTGSATLVRSLIKAGLVDELQLFLHPVVVGRGKRLFADGDAATLRLAEAKTFSTGVMRLVYQPLSEALKA